MSTLTESILYMQFCQEDPSAVLLILASTSRYRKDLMERLRIPFCCIPPEVDESRLPTETPTEMARRLAAEKSRAIHSRYPGHVVIGSDQVADWNGQALGKPGSIEAACEQLANLSGQTVVFHTAVSVSAGEQQWTTSTNTICSFRTLSEEAIRRYVDIDHPIDTAGSAKAESLGIALMESMQSDDPTAIIGLPMIALTSLLRQAGLDPLQEQACRRPS